MPLDRKGFSLVETTVVMVIIAILAGVIIVKNPFNAIKIYSATRKVAADIRYAQQLAKSTQTRCGLQYSASGYSVFLNNTPATLAQNAGDPCSDNGSRKFVVDFSAARCSMYNGVTITSTLPSGIVKFNSIGTPYGGDDALLSSPGNTATLALSGAPSRTITIEAGTGRVSY